MWLLQRHPLDIAASSDLKQIVKVSMPQWLTTHCMFNALLSSVEDKLIKLRISIRFCYTQCFSKVTDYYYI